MDALELTVDEVPGGLPMMQDLIAACHGFVGAYLFPFAIESLTTEDDVIELSNSIAARPEKKQKLLLLSALGSEGMASRLGRAAVLAGVEVLRADRSDAAFARKADVVAHRLGAVSSKEPERPRVTGLWDLVPPAPTKLPYRWYQPRRGYDGLLNPYWPYAVTRPKPHSCHPDALEWHVLSRLPMGAPEYDVLLRQCLNTIYDREAFGRDAAMCLLWLIALDSFDPAAFRQAALDRLAAGTLGLARVSSVLELTIDAGGLRALWPVLLDVAAAAAAMCPKPAGLPDLLRLLTQLVVEVPEPNVPEAIATLAAKGSSKSQAEARALELAVEDSLAHRRLATQ